MRSNRKIVMSHRFVYGACLAGLWVWTPLSLNGQETAKGAAVQEQSKDVAPAAKREPGENAPSLSIVIPDNPKSVDPAEFYPEKLTKNITIKFDDISLREFAKWLRDEQSLNVILDERTMSDGGISPDQSFSDHLVDAPLYQLLDRLSSLAVTWLFEDDILVITTEDDANSRLMTLSYNIGDLLDNGYKAQDITKMIRRFTPGLWEDADGEGGRVILLGDVLFVRNSFQVNKMISGLLAAVRKHGRRTFTFDPPQHEALRELLRKIVSADYDDTPLVEAIADLNRQLDADIRFDAKALSDSGISIYQPVNFRTTGLPLNAVLRKLSLNLGLSWTLRDGVLWVTSQEEEEHVLQTAVFDVRDLCRNQSESNGLLRAIATQTGGRWQEDDGEGGSLQSPKPGVLIIRQNLKQLDDVLSLLENYRLALRTSKFRLVDDDGPQSIVTRYYRMQKDVAADLERILPELVAPESWRSTGSPKAPGQIRMVTSRSELLNATIATPGANQPTRTTESFLIPKATLVITQTRENQDEIEKVLQKVEHGDAKNTVSGGGVGGMGGMGGGMGGMGGGFGGGFFSLPVK